MHPNALSFFADNAAMTITIDDVRAAAAAAKSGRRPSNPVPMPRRTRR
jgi:hypothetical protein